MSMARSFVQDFVLIAKGFSLKRLLKFMIREGGFRGGYGIAARDKLFALFSETDPKASTPAKLQDALEANGAVFGPKDQVKVTR